MTRIPPYTIPDDIAAAIADPADNPIAEAVAERINAYSNALAAAAARHNGFPPTVVLTAPDDAISYSALELFRRQLADAGIDVAIRFQTSTP